jgi:hypothetical protein
VALRKDNRRRTPVFLGDERLGNTLRSSEIGQDEYDAREDDAQDPHR